MYRLLVVDDEPIIVDGLYERFKELKTNQLDVYKAYSGTEALNWLNSKKIDVVITDIKMPGLDGMQLLGKIRLNWPDCKVIFLTGYDNFEYVYKAIQCSGVSYLLKTEGYERIIETVENYLEEIRKSHKNVELLQKAKLQLQKSMPILQKEFLCDLVEGNFTEVSQKQLDDVGIPFIAEYPVILIAGYIDEAQEKAVSCKRADYYRVNLVVEEHLARYASISSTIYKSYMLWILQINKNIEYEWASPSDQANCYFKGVLESVQAICGETLSVNVSFVISSSAVKWSEVSEKVISLKALLNYGRESGTEVVLTDRALYETESFGSNAQNRAVQLVRLQLKKLEAVESYLEQGRKEEFLMFLKEIKESLLQELDNASLYYEAFYSMSLLFLSYINRHNISEIIVTGADHEKLTRVDRFSSAEQAIEYFEEVAVRIFKIQKIEFENRSTAAIKKVQRYIMDNPGGDLSLGSLADMVYFNPKYLSRLFKQVTGMNLSDYILEIRLNKVKELLTENTMKVHEIAEYVGYYSAPCFTRFFKKVMGITPQEYRDSFLSAN